MPAQDDFRPSVSMLGWGYNEEENVASYVERAEAFLRQVSDDFELILVDDGSTDRMWELAVQAQATRPWLRLIRNEGNRGAAYSAKRAFAAASRQFLFWQTLDWSYDISRLVDAFPRLREVDVLQGVRSNALTLGTILSHRSDTPFKAVISYVNYQLVRVLFALPISDYQNVTVYPTALVQSFALETDSSFMNPELLLKSWWRGAVFQEVFVPFRRRSKGVAKGTRPLAIAKAIRDIFYWWWQWIVMGRRADRGRGRVTLWTVP
jgi:glycosyltransferase involved in cell wall biosynthesis